MKKYLSLLLFVLVIGIVGCDEDSCPVCEHPDYMGEMTNEEAESQLSMYYSRYLPMCNSYPSSPLQDIARQHCKELVRRTDDIFSILSVDGWEAREERALEYFGQEYEYWEEISTFTCFVPKYKRSIDVGFYDLFERSICNRGENKYISQIPIDDIYIHRTEAKIFKRYAEEYLEPSADNVEGYHWEYIVMTIVLVKK